MADIDILKILNPKLTDLDRDQMADEYNKQLWVDSLPVSETITAPPPVTRDPFSMPDLPTIMNSLPPAPPAPKTAPVAQAMPAPAPKMQAPELPPMPEAKPKMDFESLMAEQMEYIKNQQAPSLEQNDKYLDMLAKAQQQEKTDRLMDTLGRAGVMMGGALSGQGYVAPDFTLLDNMAKSIGQGKRDLIEREDSRKGMAKDKFEAAKYQYNANRDKVKDTVDLGKDLQQNRDKQKTLGMEAIKLDDQLENSKSDRATEAMQRRQQQLTLDLSKLQLRDAKAKSDPTSMISNTARTMYARELEGIDRADVAAQIATGEMSAKQIEDLLGSMNLSNLVTNFQNNLLKKELGENKKEEKKKEAGRDFEARIDNVRKSEFTKITEGYNKSMASLGNLTYLRDQKSGSGDMAILYDVIKAMDPDSVVREGEISLAKATAGKIDMLRNLPSKLTKGTVLGPEQRKELTKIAQYVASKNASKKVIQALPGIRSMIKQGEDLGMDRNEVMLRLVPPEIKGVLDEQLQAQEIKEQAIDKFMEDNNMTDRGAAITILRQAGKL